MDIVKANPTYPWHYEMMSFNPNLTIAFIREHLDKHWNWEVISSNAAISLKMIEDNPDLPWEYDHISSNPNLRLDYVLKHKDKLNFYNLSCCQFIK